jgi:hypothetical protein
MLPVLYFTAWGRKAGLAGRFGRAYLECRHRVRAGSPARRAMRKTWRPP